MRYTYRYRSFFWPAILILAGVIALLVNTGRIPVERLGLFIALWPLILIVIGLELIVRRNLHGVAGDVAAALIVLIAIAGAAGYVIVAPPAATRTLDSSADVGSVRNATLEINVGAANITLGGTTEKLYTAHIEYNGAQPAVQFDSDGGVLRIDQQSQGFTPFQGSALTVNLDLNTSVDWSIEENTGAVRAAMNLAQLHVTSLHINSGASTDDISLGPTSQVVEVKINGGAVTAHVHRPAGTDVKVDVSGGFVNLVVDGKTYHGIGSAGNGTELGASGYDIKVNGGACTVTVDTAGGSD
jgi:cell wall-active antibiotic response 4TMS protein YvqF